MQSRLILEKLAIRCPSALPRMNRSSRLSEIRLATLFHVVINTIKASSERTKMPVWASRWLWAAGICRALPDVHGGDRVERRRHGRLRHVHPFLADERLATDRRLRRGDRPSQSGLEMHRPWWRSGRAVQRLIRVGSAESVLSPS